MLSFTESIELWCEHLEAAGLSLGSIGTYRKHLNSLLNSTRGSWPSYPDILRWQRGQRGLADSTKHNRAKTVKTFLAWAEENEIVGSKVGRKMAVPRRPKSLPPSVPDELFDRLLDPKLRLKYRRGERDLAKRDLAICRLMVLTGLRRAEVCTLDVGHVDVQARTLRVERGKGSKDRVVPLHPAVDLVPWVQGRKASEPLFVGRYGKRLMPDSLSYVFVRKVAPALGQRVYPHLLRHAFASYLCRKGVPVRQIQELLGHESLATTQLYMQTTGEDLRGAIGAFDSLFT